MKKKYLLITALIVTFTVFAPGIALLRSSTPDAQTKKALALFVDAFVEVKRKYVEEVDEKKLVEAAINGMLTSLDPHSMYLDKKTFEEMMLDTKGEYGGLGIEITADNGLIRIVSPIDDTPAFKAGIKSGDYIIAINDESVIGMNLNDAVKMMRGGAGKKIHLTMIREGKNEPLEIDLIREVIKIKTVKAKYLDGIAYFRISKFSEQTTESLRKEIADLLLHHNKSTIKGIVLDLRDNPGGILDQAISVTDCFLDAGEVVSTRGREKADIKHYKATGNDLLKGIKMVVLINGGSASAAEIVAGALQDHKRAIIMGNKSFGKASVQMVLPISADTAIKLTTARYYTPSGKSIQAQGIVPDIETPDAKVTFSNEKDMRRIFSESKLKGHLKGDAEKKAPTPTSKELINKINNPVKEDLYQTDFQLARAIDLLKALQVLNDK
jgi:carboxyl-terminal processing protease